MGWILGSYPFLAAIRQLRSFQDLNDFIKEEYDKLKGILEFFGNFFHYLLLPWEYFKKIIYEILPIAIPIEWYDSIVIVSFLTFIPLRLIIYHTSIKESMKSWEEFKNEVIPLFEEEPNILDTKSLFNRINQNFNLTKYKTIALNIVGPPIEYFFNLFYLPSNSVLIDSQKKALEYFGELDKFYSKLNGYYKKNKKHQRIRIILFGLFFLIVIVDKSIYYSSELLSFIKITIIVAFILPFLTTIFAWIFGMFFLFYHSLQTNPVRRAKNAEMLANGLFGQTRLLRKFFDLEAPKKRGKVWGEKITYGQGVVAFFPGEIEIAKKFTYIENKKIKTNHIRGPKDYYYKLQLSQISPIYFDNSREETMVKLFPRVARKRKKNLKLYDWVLKAEYYYHQNNIEKAIDCLEASLSINPEFPLAYQMLGSMYRETGNLDDAEEYLRKGLRVKPISISIRNSLAFVYCDRGEFVKAIKEFDTILKRVNHVDILMNKGQLYLHLKEYNNAVECFDKLLETISNHSEALFLRGQAYNHLKKYQKAIDDLNVYLDYNPNNPVALHFLSHSKMRLFRYEEALQNIEKAIQIELNDTRISLKGHILFAIGEFEEGFNCFLQALEINSKNPDNKSNIGLGKYYLGEYEEALEYLNEVLEEFPDNSVALLYRSTVNLVLENIEQGVKDNILARKKSSDSIRYYLNQGIYLFKKGEINQSCEQFEIAANAGLWEARKWLQKIRQEKIQ